MNIFLNQIDSLKTIESSLGSQLQIDIENTF